MSKIREQFESPPPTPLDVAPTGDLKPYVIFTQLRKGGPHIANTGITEAEAGKAQTILVLGSDRRFDEDKRNNPRLRRSVPARSDTVMLIRLDPHQPATSILSLPRDLRVEIPGHGTDKLNQAYTLGGATLPAAGSNRPGQ